MISIDLSAFDAKVIILHSIVGQFVTRGYQVLKDTALHLHTKKLIFNMVPKTTNTHVIAAIMIQDAFLIGTIQHMRNICVSSPSEVLMSHLSRLFTYLVMSQFLF